MIRKDSMDKPTITNKFNNSSILSQSNSKIKVATKPTSSIKLTTQNNKSQVQPNKNIANKPLHEESIENLKSLYYQLEFINLQFQSSFKIQKETAERGLLEKVQEIIKLREYIFNLSSKLNNMMNISKIEEYLNLTYNKLMTIQPKLSNVIENIDDLKGNINYGLDRLFLEDNIVCDESTLKKNLDNVCTNLDKLNTESQTKFNHIEKIKENYENFYELVENEKIAMDRLSHIVEEYETNVLDDNIDKITNFLSKENNKLTEQLLK